MQESSQLNVHGHRLVTLIGDAVNLAARLEGLNKYLGTQLFITEFTWKLVSGHFAARSLGRFRVIGKREPVVIYEVLGPKVTGFIQSTMATFDQGLTVFQRGDLTAAPPLRADPHPARRRRRPRRILPHRNRPPRTTRRSRAAPTSRKATPHNGGSIAVRESRRPRRINSTWRRCFSLNRQRVAPRAVISRATRPRTHG